MIYFYIPVYNEQATVGVLLYRLIQVMREVDMEYEVYLTLDGCTDESAQVVEPYMKKLPLLITQNDKRLGYGKCLNEAIRKISGASQNPKRDFFMVLDADFSFDPDLLKEMAAGIERNSVLYIVDRMSMPKNRLGVGKRMANRLAAKILRRRGAEFPDGADLLSTVRGCRVQHLRRNMPRLEALNMLDARTPPAVSGVMLYLALQDNSRKTDVIEVREQRMRRAAGRFSVTRVLRKLMFSGALERVIEDFEGGRDGSAGGRRSSRRDRSRSKGQQGQQSQQGRQEQKQDGEQKSGQQPGSRRSRGGRGRRGRRSSGGGGQQQGQASQQDKQPKSQSQSGGQQQTQQSGTQQQGQGGQQGKQEQKQGGEQRSSSKRSRRRRRRPNKRSQGSSNTPQGNSQDS